MWKPNNLTIFTFFHDSCMVGYPVSVPVEGNDHSQLQSNAPIRPLVSGSEPLNTHNASGAFGDMDHNLSTYQRASFLNYEEKPVPAGTGYYIPAVFIDMGISARSHPSAEATLSNVSNCGIAFLLSNRAITDCGRLASCASWRCVFPCLCRCSMS